MPATGGLLEACGGYVVTDRKFLGMMHNVVRPFLFKYVLKAGVKLVGALQKMVNDRFLMGIVPWSGSWVSFATNSDSCAVVRRRRTSSLCNCPLQFFFHLWNSECDNLDQYFNHELKTHQEHGKEGSLFLGHYRVNPARSLLFFADRPYKCSKCN